MPILSYQGWKGSWDSYRRGKAIETIETATPEEISSTTAETETPQEQGSTSSSSGLKLFRIQIIMVVLSLLI